MSGLALQLVLTCAVDGAIDSTPCAERCPDDDAGRQCPPGCAACACCHHASVYEASAEPRVVSGAGRAVPTEQPQGAPAVPAPGQLLRPPILPLA